MAIIINRGIRRRVGRRRVLQGMAAAGVASGLSFGRAGASETLAGIGGTEFDLTIGALPVDIAGRRTVATAVNDLVPGPLLR